MARIRKFAAYRRVERPYTRHSKFRKKSFVRTTPKPLIVKFTMGKYDAKYDHTLILSPKQDTQIRDNALESARMTSLKVLEPLGKTAFSLKIRPYPFHILRENPLAAGAGADRFSTGMKASFGKPIGQAVRLKKGQPLFEVKVNKANLSAAKKALTRAKCKLPVGCMIEVK